MAFVPIDPPLLTRAEQLDDCTAHPALEERFTYAAGPESSTRQDQGCGTRP
jgi:hypothetical protein